MQRVNAPAPPAKVYDAHGSAAGDAMFIGKIGKILGALKFQYEHHRPYFLPLDPRKHNAGRPKQGLPHRYIFRSGSEKQSVSAPQVIQIHPSRHRHTRQTSLEKRRKSSSRQNATAMHVRQPRTIGDNHRHPRPHRENDKPHATPWFEGPDGKLMRTLIVPEGMSIETARSIVDDVENTTD